MRRALTIVALAAVAAYVITLRRERDFYRTMFNPIASEAARWQYEYECMKGDRDSYYWRWVEATGADPRVSDY